MNGERPFRILVIDDEEDICAALRSIFEYQGWRVFTANRVRQGLELLRGQKPDIVIIDYHMPEINGILGVKMIRNLDGEIPIVVLTIDENQEVADRFLAAGANDFALKPIKTLDIISRIRLHIQLMSRRPPKAEVSKGIGASTLYLLSQFLKHSGEFLTAEEISQQVGLAYPTTYRYLQHLLEQGVVEVQTTYGKVGRPKQRYRLRDAQRPGEREEA